MSRRKLIEEMPREEKLELLDEYERSYKREMYEMFPQECYDEETAEEVSELPDYSKYVEM